MIAKSIFFKINASTILLFFVLGVANSQPVSIKWFPEIKTDKDQRTLLLLNAGEQGFQILRWQDSRTGADGSLTPAMPILTSLAPDGERQHDEILPGFENGRLHFRFAFTNDSVLLVVYESSNSVGSQSLFARRYSLLHHRWSAEAQVLFTDASNRAPAFASAWFSRSANGRQTCVYHMQSGTNHRIATAIFDADLRLLWQRTNALPTTSGQLAMRQVFTSDSGAVLVHCQIFNPGSKAKGRAYESSPAVYLSNGKPPYRQDEWVTEAIPYSDAIFLLATGSEGMADFYPRIGKKFSPSFEISEGPDGKIYCAGFYSDDGNEQADGYFVYAINPGLKQGEMLVNMPLPTSVRKAYLNDKAVAKKEAVKGLALRWLRWAEDGRPWMLAERQSFDSGPWRLEEAVLLRLDSSFRINNTRKLEKFQRLPTGDPQNFMSIAACPAPKNGWWLLWNQGNWPNAKIMLTEFRTSGSATEYMLDASSHSNVSILPQTLLPKGDNWYFVGESEYHERFRVGMLVK